MNWNQLRRIMRKHIAADFDAHKQMGTPFDESVELVMSGAFEELIDTLEDIVEERIRKLESWQRRKNKGHPKPFKEKDIFHGA